MKPEEWRMAVGTLVDLAAQWIAERDALTAKVAELTALLEMAHASQSTRESFDRIRAQLVPAAVSAALEQAERAAPENPYPADLFLGKDHEWWRRIWDNACESYCRAIADIPRNASALEAEKQAAERRGAERALRFGWDNPVPDSQDATYLAEALAALGYGETSAGD